MGGTEKKTKVQDIAEGLSLLDASVKTGGGQYAYAILSRDATGLTVTEKANKPCYGELRPYKTEITVTDDTPYSQIERKKDYHPGDLPHKFPTGEILGVSIKAIGSARSSAGFKLMFDRKESPWSAGLQSLTVLGPGEGYGYLIQEPDFGPSSLISLLMTARNWEANKAKKFEWFAKLHNNPRVALLATLLTWSWNPATAVVGDTNPYALKAQGMNVASFVQQKPFDIDGGATWRERAAYNRPWIHRLFGHGFTNKIPFGLDVGSSEEKALALLVTLDTDGAGPVPTEMSGAGVDIIATCGDRHNSA